MRIEEERTANSGFAKKRVQWLIEHSTSHQLLCYVDNFELRNPLLRKAAKRCEQVLPHSTNGTAVFFDRLQATLIDFIFLR